MYFGVRYIVEKEVMVTQPIIFDGTPQDPQPSIPDYPSEPPRLGEIYDTLPLLMNWKLAYLLSVITLCFVLTNYILNAYEDHLDKNDKIDMKYSSHQHNEETVGLLAENTATIVSATGVYGAITKASK
ncbi:hypothetical protein K492DRAFT_234069 [Lichtheimia hyalospora FSU 10163]|nr:hypothetical protein K492DRAFT_234069 [Lichtheimia hyalospora FSU 10163]